MRLGVDAAGARARPTRSVFCAPVGASARPATHGFQDPRGNVPGVRAAAGRSWATAPLPALTPVILLALLLMAGQAAAQASPAVDISGQSGEGKVAVDHPASFTFNVQNNRQAAPQQGSNGADRVVVHVDGVPDGWTASVSPSDFRLAAGASATVTVQVSVSPGAAGRQATMTVVADIYSALEGLDPYTSGVPGASQHASASAPLAVRVDNSLTRDVLETLGPWVYVLAILLVLAVLVAIAIAVSARRALVRLVSDTRERPITPGGKAAFPFRVEGLARDTDTVLMQVSAVQEGWAAFLPVPELILEPGQSHEVSLVVIAPRGAAQGTKQAVLVTATSAKAPKGAANLEFIAVVQGPEELEATRRPKA